MVQTLADIIRNVYLGRPRPQHTNGLKRFIRQIFLKVLLPAAVILLVILLSLIYFIFRIMLPLFRHLPVASIFTAIVAFIILRLIRNFAQAACGRRRSSRATSSDGRYSRNGESSLLDFLSGNVLNEKKSQVEWSWSNPSGDVDANPIVGQTHYFDVLLFKSNNRPYHLPKCSPEQEALLRGDSINEDDDNTAATAAAADAFNNLNSFSNDVAYRSGGEHTDSHIEPNDNDGKDHVKVEVLIECIDTCEPIGFVEEVAPCATKPNAVRYSFRVNRSGTYTISILVNGYALQCSPHTQMFAPDQVSPSNVRRSDDCSVVIGEFGEEVSFEVELRDKFDNICHNYDSMPLRMDVDFAVSLLKFDSEGGVEEEEGEVPVVFYVSSPEDCKPGHCTLNIALGSEGCYTVLVKFQNELIKNGQFQLIFLTEQEKMKLSKVNEKSMFKGELLPCDFCAPLSFSSFSSSVDGPSSDIISISSRTTQTTTTLKTTEVWCYFTPKHLNVAKYHLKLFRKTLASFRLTPFTKFEFSNENYRRRYSSGGDSKKVGPPKPFLQIDDGIQMPVGIKCEDRNVIVASFVQRMLKNIGGSESFSMRRKHFQEKVCQYCQISPDSNSAIRHSYSFKADRTKLIESSMSCLNRKDIWTKLFVVKFVGEAGEDCGGLRREWLSLLCGELFHPNFALFHKLTPDNPNSPLHPSPAVPKCSLKYLEFAGKILAKSLLESTISQSNQASLPCRLSKSFIAQLIGLRVNMSHLEVDNPELFKQKVKYIMENDVTDLELTFTEEEFSEKNPSQVIVHELVPQGAKMPVTNANKKYYVDQLVQFKLVSSTKQQVEEFKKGFDAVLPTELLTMFSENEIELMLCGAPSINVTDFKLHSIESTAGIVPNKKYKIRMNWFWTLVESLSQDELGLLLQFITGSCKLPVGGFKELQPKIEIRFNNDSLDILPIAHTCFNRLVMPNYSSYQTMHKMLLLALNEGSSGFAFS